MNKWTFSALLGGLVIGLVGCELDDNLTETARQLKFENSSQRNVKVISLSGEFETFVFGPSQKVTLEDIRLPDYDWSPKDKVQVSSRSSSRNVIFVDGASPFIVFTNAPP